MRIGSAEWYEAHPDAPSASEAGEYRVYSRPTSQKTIDSLAEWGIGTPSHLFGQQPEDDPTQE